MSEVASLSAAPSLTALHLLADPDRLLAELSEVPMLAGIGDEELLELSTAMTPVDLAPGEVLWHQAAAARGLHVLLSGEVATFRRLPGEREFEVARVGPGTVFGGILLLGGGTQLATARAATACSLLFLPGAEFQARMQLRRPSALRLKARILENTCARIRGDHAGIASALSSPTASPPSWTGAVSAPAAAHDPSVSPVVSGPDRGCAARAPMPALAYVSRLPFFSGWPGPTISSFLGAGEALNYEAGCVIIEEGDMPRRCFIVLNGAVEDVIQRGAHVSRVRFSGPGRAFSYLSFFDGLRATVSSRARERTVVLAVDADDFRSYLRGSDDASRRFAAAIETDLLATLHATASPKAYLVRDGAR